MRTLINFRNGWSCALLLSIVVSCKHADSSEVTPDSPPCQVQTINSATTEYGSTSNSATTTFSYDTKGQLTSVVTSDVVSKTTETYTYDDSGYTTTYKRVSASQVGSQTSRDESYSYTNSRLSKITFKVVSQFTGISSTQTTGTTVYIYDATGALAQLVTSSSTTTSALVGLPPSTSTSSSTRSYTNGVLTSIQELTNGKETTTYTVENGRITVEATTNGSKKRYTYNADGYQTKQEDISAANAVTSTAVTEYGSTPAPKSVYPTQKGFPTVQPVYGKEDRTVTHNTTVYGGTIIDFQLQNQLNSKGYPVKSVKTNTGTNGTTTTTYTYTNCP